MDYGPVKDFDQSTLDRSLSPAVGFLAGHPVYGNLSVNSGRRSKASNRKAGGAKKSQHLLGKALDLDVSRLSNAQKSQLLSDLASYGIKGIGIYAGGQTIHIDARKNFATWGANPKDKYAGVEISQQPRWARQALTAIQQAGPYKAFPAAPAAVPGTASLAIGPAGTSLADAYRTAQYQRAMPEGPTPPATAPVPTSRPLDSVGGLGAAYRTAALGRVAPSSPAVPVGERFGYPASPASLPSMTPDERVAAAHTLNDMLAGRNMPVGPATRQLSPASVESPQLSQQKRDMQAAYDRQIGQSQRFRPSAAPAAVHPSIANFSNIREPGALVPGGAELGEVVTARPGSLRGPRKDYSQRFRPAAAPTSMPPAAPAPAPARSMTAAVPATVATAAPAPAPSRFGPVAPAAAPAPSRFGAVAMQDDVAMAPQPNSPPLGAVTAPFGPTVSPEALAAARNLGTATAAQQIAPPAAMDAARKLGTAIAAQQINAPAAIPPDPRQTAYASMPPGTPAALAEKVSQPAPQQVAAAPQTAQQAQQRPAGGIPAGLAGPWGADISMQQQPAVDQMTTQSMTQPTTFGEKLTNAAQRYGPQIAGTLIAGPIGGLIGGLLGRSFDAARPGQVFGNPFGGLANTAQAMGMFQSGTPYSGPISHYGTGLRAIGDVLGGAAPVGSRAYSRSTPGYHVTALPGGTIQRTNQYGFTSFERPSMGPTRASFSGFTGPGGMFSGGGGFFGGWGGGDDDAERSSGGRTSGGGKSSGGRSSGGGKSSGGGATGHSKSSRY